MRMGGSPEGGPAGPALAWRCGRETRMQVVDRLPTDTALFVQWVAACAAGGPGMRWVGQLARRKVLRVGAVYLAMAWVLLQLTDIVAPALELPGWTLRMVLWLLVLGFPVAGVLAWYFNLGEHGLEREHEDGADAAAPRTRKRDWALLAAIAVLGIGVGVAAQRLLAPFGTPAPAAAKAPAPTASGTSVAVLPFVNMGGSVEDGYFADGLSEEILNSLANVPGLKVAGRTSSFSYKGRDQDIRKIGRELGVAHVIEGSVRRQGQTLRVTAQLIKADDGFHLWSQTFDRRLDDALAIQSEIASAVADKLELSVMPARAGATALDSQSQQAYLRALGLIGESGEASLVRAVGLLRPLQQAHPEFIPAYLPLADSVQRLGWYGSIPWLQAFGQMEALSSEASRRAPGDLDVRVLAALIPFARNDLAPTWRGYERVLATHRKLADEAPNHPLLQLNTADAARILDQRELALRYADRYVALEPRDPKGHVAKGLILRDMGRDDEAAAALRRAIAVSPTFEAGNWELARQYARVGRYRETLAAAADCQRAGGSGCAAVLADMYRILRQPDLARAAERRSAFAMQAKYDAFEAERRRGGYQAALAWLQRQGDEGESLKRYFGDDLVTAALEAGDYADVIELRRELSPGTVDLEEPLLGSNLDAANEVGVAMLRTGREADARRMFQRVVDATRRLPAVSRRRLSQLPEATALAWLGDRDGAMQVIRREVAAGWVCEYYFTETNVDAPDPLVEPLRGLPGFQQLMRQVRERNAGAFAALAASGRPLIPDEDNDPASARL